MPSVPTKVVPQLRGFSVGDQVESFCATIKSQVEPIVAAAITKPCRALAQTVEPCGILQCLHEQFAVSKTAELRLAIWVCTLGNGHLQLLWPESGKLAKRRARSLKTSLS
jgi:hypothetical protein